MAGRDVVARGRQGAGRTGGFAGAGGAGGAGGRARVVVQGFGQCHRAAERDEEAGGVMDEELDGRAVAAPGP